MGYHDAREIPNYWAYAQNFVLDDHMFEPNRSWSLPAHLYMVSAWSALLHEARRPDELPQRHHAARGQPPNHGGVRDRRRSIRRSHFAWTDLTYLLHRDHVSWGYYIEQGTRGRLRQRRDDLRAAAAGVGKGLHDVPASGTRCRSSTTSTQDGQTGNVQDVSTASTRPRAPGRCPRSPGSCRIRPTPSTRRRQVTRRAGVRHRPDQHDHARARTGTAPRSSSPGTTGAASTTTSRRRRSTRNGYGLRVPAIVISPYAKRGLHRPPDAVSFDAYIKFIEDDFLGGQRLDPRPTAAPTPGPTSARTRPILGNLAKDFDFTQTPRPPMLLPLHPRPGPASQMGPKRAHVFELRIGPDRHRLSAYRPGRRSHAAPTPTVAVPPQPSRSRRAGTPVADALVTFDGRRVHTNRHGRATITLSMRHRGSVQVADDAGPGSARSEPCGSAEPGQASNARK